MPCAARRSARRPRAGDGHGRRDPHPLRLRPRAVVATYPVPMATRPTEKPKASDADQEKQPEAVADDEHRYIDPVVGPDDDRRFTDSGIEVDRLHDAGHVAPGLGERLRE